MTLGLRLLIASGGGSFDTPPEDEDDMTFHGAKAYNNATSSWADQDQKPFPLNSTEYDTDAYHFTSSSNLTGTVSKTESSTTITGSGTSFTTELSVNQAIAIPGTATEIGIVRSITSNTSLTVWQTMANTASGQTAARRNDVLAVPLGRAGYYEVIAGCYVLGNPAQDAPLYIVKNGPGTSAGGAAFNAALVRGSQFTPYTAQPNSVGGIGHVHADLVLAEGDYVQGWLYLDNNFGGGSFTIGGSSASGNQGLQMWVALKLTGT